MKRSYLVCFAVAAALGVVLACSGSSPEDVFGPSSSGGTNDSGTSDGSSSGSNGGQCPPCAAPPDPACTGTGPCGCGPYVCPDASTEAGPGDDCTWAPNDPCGPGMYCFAPGCGKGKCRPRSKNDSANRAPVCGCNGLTYWNEAVAAKSGMSVKTDGACSSGTLCGGFGLPCPDGAKCNYHFSSESGCKIADFPGTCWVLPETCPQVTVGSNAKSCDGVCADECTQIKNGKRWYETNSCPQ